MSDVAVLAGVALGTVSNALNHPEKVAAPTLQRIQSAIDTLGFVRNNQARSLATGKSNTLGLIVTDIGNSFFVDIAKGAEEAAQELGMTLLLANSDNSFDKQNTYLEVFDQARLAGTLLAPFEASAETLGRFRSHGRRPILLLNVAPNDVDACSVVVDNEHGGYIAARHLIELGRRKLAFVGGPDRLEPLLERRLGVERAIREAGGGVSLEEIIVGAVNSPEGRGVGEQIKDRADGERPDGIVAASDLLALGVVQALQGSISVPDEIAIIGYDNNNAVWESLVPISTIAQPGHAMGYHGAKLLIDEVSNAGEHSHETVTLLPRLIPRASSIGTHAAQALVDSA